jgi:uncharacterized protein
MRRKKLLYSIGLCLCLTACGQAGANLRTVHLKGSDGREKAAFQVELAVKASEWEQGLMARECLPIDQGMLFIFPEAAPRSFWMKNTLVPLDIIFFDGNGKLINTKTAGPCVQEPCDIYTSSFPAQSVLEINAGLAAEVDLGTGDQLILE